ncbi:hypothetical protein KY289_007459 [Solanum tuberosum]|nr:hypothetical protein KY289_007459 [Solanum tuberosum]
MLVDWLLPDDPGWKLHCVVGTRGVGKTTLLKKIFRDPIVHDAGHMVPMDQPKAALEMLKRWTRGTFSQQTTEPEN